MIRQERERKMEYTFDKALQEARIVKRNSQFTMNIEMDGEIIKAHCPATTRIGDVDLAGVACLLSKSDDPKRKLKYTVEAVSFDNPDTADKNWVGINLILSNRIVEFLLNTHQLDEMVSDYDEVKREVFLGVSKLDFLVGNTYLEVKTPLTTVNVKYGDQIKTKKVTPFSSTDRMVRHVKELASSLKDHERAILLTVQQYEETDVKPHLHSTHYEEVKAVMSEAVAKGVESWNISLRFTPTGVSLLKLTNTTQDLLSY